MADRVTRGADRALIDAAVSRNLGGLALRRIRETLHSLLGPLGPATLT